MVALYCFIVGLVWFGLIWLFGEFGELAVCFTLCAFHQDKQSLLVDMRQVGAIDCNKCGIKFGAGWKWECLFHRGSLFIVGVPLLLATELI